MTTAELEGALDAALRAHRIRLPGTDRAAVLDLASDLMTAAARLRSTGAAGGD